MRRLWLLALAVALMALTAGLPNGHASAAAVTYKGIAVTPAIVQIDLPRGKDKASFTIGVTNNTRTWQRLYVSSLDFRSLSDTGGLTFVGNDVNQLHNAHGLTSWLDIPTSPFDLSPGATKQVTMTIENRSDLAPGGHYAAVLFKSDGTASESGQNPVTINQVVSSLVFVRKLDGAQASLKLTSASLNGSLFRRPDTANLVFLNNGNIQEVPRGLVKVSAPDNREVKRGIINTDSSLLLPDSTRLYQVPLTPSGAGWWPGRYHASVTYRYDNGAQQTMQLSFWYVNLLFLPLAAAAVAGVWYLWRQRRRIRRFFKLRRAASYLKKQ